MTYFLGLTALTGDFLSAKEVLNRICSRLWL